MNANLVTISLLSFFIFQLPVSLMGSSETIDLSKHSSPINANNRAVILYSGGLDSSAVVAILAARGYKELHLLTFDNGAQNHLDYAKIKLPDFERQFPKTKFIHVIIPSTYLFKKIALKDIESDIKTYDSNLICAGCKMAMHALALTYAIKHEIYHVLDGFARRQEAYPEQDPCFKEDMKKIYDSFHIDYENPLYEELATADAAKDILSRYNLSTKSVEPGCLFGGTFSRANTPDSF